MNFVKIVILVNQLQFQDIKIQIYYIIQEIFTHGMQDITTTLINSFFDQLENEYFQNLSLWRSINSCLDPCNPTVSLEFGIVQLRQSITYLCAVIKKMIIMKLIKQKLMNILLFQNTNQFMN